MFRNACGDDSLLLIYNYLVLFWIREELGEKTRRRLNFYLRLPGAKCRYLIFIKCFRRIPGRFSSPLIRKNIFTCAFFSSSLFASGDFAKILVLCVYFGNIFTLWPLHPPPSPVFLVSSRSGCSWCVSLITFTALFFPHFSGLGKILLICIFMAISPTSFFFSVPSLLTSGKYYIFFRGVWSKEEEKKSCGISVAKGNFYLYCLQATG